MPHFVNRLDKGTSGLLIAAKTGYIHDRFRHALHSENLRREYRAIAVGHVSPPCGNISLPIGRQSGSIIQRCVCEDGLPCSTDYQVLCYRNNLTLLRLLPHTGRTHQLRVHMSALGYPLAGDWLYGKENNASIQRPALHSYRLEFLHPLSSKQLSFTAPLPQDMMRLMKEEDGP